MMKSILFLFFGVFFAQAQDNYFQEEVTAIKKKYDTLWDASKPSIVFTGSSSIRLWKDLEERFPKYQILNTGFGGSQSWDLASFLDELILDYNPKKVFIYEGDNDIFSKRKPKEIIATFNQILDTLQTKRPNMDIVLISAKPSISRWRYRRKYKKLNMLLNVLANERDHITYADVWSIMLKNGRRLKKDLFISDGLHMNAKGYELWYEVIKNHVFIRQ